MAGSVGAGAQPGVWQAGSVIEVYSATEARWLVALVTQVGKGQMSAWVADERRTLGPKALSFSGLQIGRLGSNVTALPLGFQMVPSKSRPGQVAFLDHSEKRKYSSRELAWRCHIERNVDLTAGLLHTQAGPCEALVAQSAPRDIYASPPGDIDDEPPASHPPPRLPVTAAEARAQPLCTKVKVEPQAAAAAPPPPPQPQSAGGGLCSAASLPRAAEAEPEPPRPRSRQASAQAAPPFVGAQAHLPPAAPRCGGDKCGAFCPLRLKRLAARCEDDGVNRWTRRQRARHAPAGEAEAAAVAGAAAAAAAARVPDSRRESRRAEAARPTPPPPPEARPPARAEDAGAAAAPREFSKAAEPYAEQVAAALARTAGMPNSQRTPLFHFPALVAMGFPPAQARRALETTRGDLKRAVEFCVHGGEIPAPGPPVVIEASQPSCSQPPPCSSQAAPALPLARASRGKAVEDSLLSWPDTAEDRLRAAEEAAAFADELHEEAVAAAIAECERLHDVAPSASPRAHGASEAFEEALQAAWERYREEAPEPTAKPCPAAVDLPGSLQSSPFAESQTQPELPRGGRRTGAGPGARLRGGSGRPRTSAAAAAAAAVVESKLAEEPAPSAGVQFFDGPLSLPCAGAGMATQPQDAARPRGGRRAGSPLRVRSGRAGALPPATVESQSSLKEEEASVKEEEGGEEDADLFGEEGAAPGVVEATQAARRGSSDVGSQLESLLAAAIDVPDDMDLDGLPATGGSGGEKEEKQEEEEAEDAVEAASPSPRAPWDSQERPEDDGRVPAGDNAVSQICASPLLPWGASSLPGATLGTQGATAWEPSAMY